MNSLFRLHYQSKLFPAMRTIHGRLKDHDFSHVKTAQQDVYKFDDLRPEEPTEEPKQTGDAHVDEYFSDIKTS